MPSTKQAKEKDAWLEIGIKNIKTNYVVFLSIPYEVKEYPNVINEMIKSGIERTEKETLPIFIRKDKDSWDIE